VQQQGHPAGTGIQRSPDDDLFVKTIGEIFAEVQGLATRGDLQADLIAQLGMGVAAKPGGAAVPQPFDVGNFSHRYAEALIPESQLPRGLDDEVSIELPDGSKKRLDRVDRTNGRFYEVKPYTPPQVKAGKTQVKLYEAYLNGPDCPAEMKLPEGMKWKGEVVTYDRKKVTQFLNNIGWLPQPPGTPPIERPTTPLKFPMGGEPALTPTGQSPTPEVKPAPAGDQTAATKELQVIAESRGLRIKKEGGFVKIGALGFIAIATSTGIILLSTDRLEAVKELALSVAYTEAFGRLFMKFGKVGGGVAFILTGVLTMESDQGPPSEERVLENRIAAFMYETYPNIKPGSKEYEEISQQIKRLHANPYVFKKPSIPITSMGEQRSVRDLERLISNEPDPMLRSELEANKPVY